MVFGSRSYRHIRQHHGHVARLVDETRREREAGVEAVRGELAALIADAIRDGAAGKTANTGQFGTRLRGKSAVAASGRSVAGE